MIFNTFDTLEEFETAQAEAFEAEKTAMYASSPAEEIAMLDNYYAKTTRKVDPIFYEGKYIAKQFSQNYATIEIEDLNIS